MGSVSSLLGFGGIFQRKKVLRRFAISLPQWKGRRPGAATLRIGKDDAPNQVWFRRPHTEGMQMKRGYLHLSAIVLAVAIASPAGLAKQFVYPAKGQSAQQQEKDEAECYTWAVQQSGFDPAKPPPQQPAAKAPTTATGTTPGAGVRGAAGGAAVGAIVGDAGAGAAAGAVVGRSQSRRQNAAAAQQQSQQQQAANAQQQAAFGKARAACLEGRGYTVK